MKRNSALCLVLFGAFFCTLSGCSKLEPKKATTTTTGLTWTHAASLSTSNVYQMVMVGSTIFAATSTGIYSSANTGSTWTLVGGGLPANIQVTTIAVSGTNIYAGTNMGLYYSTNSGTSWTAATGTTIALADALTVSGNNIFASNLGPGVYLSTDNGSNWTAINSGLPATGSVISLTANGNNIYAGVVVENGNGGAVGTNIYLSTNNGTSWTALGTGLPQVAGPTSLAVNGNTLYAWITGYTSADVPSGSGFYFSTNNGGSWSAPSGTGLPTVTLFNALSMASSGNSVFAGFDFSGVYRSTDNGSTWTQLGDVTVKNLTVGCIVIAGTTIIIGDNFSEAGVYTAAL